MDIQESDKVIYRVGKKFATYIINKGHISMKLFWNQFQCVFPPHTCKQLYNTSAVIHNLTSFDTACPGMALDSTG